MSKIMRTEILIETERQLIIRWRGNIGPERSQDDGRNDRPAPHHCCPNRPGRQKWEINPSAFAALLARLAPEAEAAAAEYVRIHARLTKLFECRGCQSPAELADETINRVARRLHEGQEISAEQPIRYFYGVARNVAREYFDQQQREFLPIEELPPAAHPAEDPVEQDEMRAARLAEERLIECLRQGLSELPQPSRELLLDYERGEQGARIEVRREMARRLGITANALKIRVYQIRRALERRINQLLENDGQ